LRNISTTKIAEICGVSQGTVDRALNNRPGISPKTKEKILAVVKEYGYRPNMHARCMAKGKSLLVGVVVFDLNNQYFSDILAHIESGCRAKGYSTVVMFTGKDPKKEIECIQNLYHMTVDGIVLCPVNGGEEYENFLSSLNIPIVTFGNKLTNFPYIGIDNCQAMMETVTFAANKGYAHLIYVKPALTERNTFAQTERLNAFIAACDKAKVSHTITSLQNASKELHKGKRNAFICPTDIYAVKLLPVANQYQSGIIGFDNIRLIDELSLCLDSIAYDIEATAKAATDYIIEGKAIPPFIKHKLICRGSI